MMKNLRVAALALLLAGCSGMPGSGVDGPKFLSALDGPKVPTVQDTLLESAKDAEKDGNFAQAAQLYQQALEKHPGDAALLLSFADSTRRSGDSDKAIAVYDALIAQDAGNVAAKEGKALALMAKGDY